MEPSNQRAFSWTLTGSGHVPTGVVRGAVMPVSGGWGDRQRPPRPLPKAEREGKG